ncbi:dipeptidase PepE [Glaciecola sp. 1036]|uniref:dipeptidase PepE n=1 Tax=Alteromonadaceae TaxID=72275 RepID=UPI003CFE5B7D
MKVLMLSSSSYADYDYLAYAQDWIQQHLENISEVVFVPFAGVTIDWDEYTQKVQDALPFIKVIGLHSCDSPSTRLQNAQAILVGGGNTFNLLHQLYLQELLPIIKQKIASGTPYIGWSAGSNICGLSIRTTNDMPIIEPKSFDALAVLNAQLNPHYTDQHMEGFHGETRDQRLLEFSTLWPEIPVIGIREGSALLLENNQLRLLGTQKAVLFHGAQKKVIEQDHDLAGFLNNAK